MKKVLIVMVAISPFIVSINLLNSFDILPSNKFFNPTIIISLVFGVVTAILVDKYWPTSKREKGQKIANEILDALYDPEEHIEQITSQEVKRYISILKEIGYTNIASTFENVVAKKNIDNLKIPDPDEIRKEFTEKVIKYLENSKPRN